jgi:hypothetical protein
VDELLEAIEAWQFAQRKLDDYMDGEAMGYFAREEIAAVETAQVRMAEALNAIIDARVRAILAEGRHQ